MLSTSRNMLFLGVESEDFLRAAAVLLLWWEEYVEPVMPPAAPVQVLAQQLLQRVPEVPGPADLQVIGVHLSDLLGQLLITERPR